MMEKGDKYSKLAWSSHLVFSVFMLKEQANDSSYSVAKQATWKEVSIALRKKKHSEANSFGI